MYASSFECLQKNDTLFQAEVPSLGYRVYYLREEGEASPSDKSSVRTILCTAPATANNHSGTVVRLYETDGKRYSRHRGRQNPAPSPFGHITEVRVRIFYLADGESQWTPVLFSEYPSQTE